MVELGRLVVKLSARIFGLVTKTQRVSRGRRALNTHIVPLKRASHWLIVSSPSLGTVYKTQNAPTMKIVRLSTYGVNDQSEDLNGTEQAL